MILSNSLWLLKKKENCMDEKMAWEPSNQSTQTYEELLHEIDQLLELAKIDSQSEDIAPF